MFTCDVKKPCSFACLFVNCDVSYRYNWENENVSKHVYSSQVYIMNEKAFKRINAILLKKLVDQLVQVCKTFLSYRLIVLL